MERADHPWLERAARVGYVANGVLHLLTGAAGGRRGRAGAHGHHRGPADTLRPALGHRADLGGTSDSAGATSSLTARLMAHPAGVVALLLTGAGLVAMAGYYVVKGVTRRFRKDLRRSSDAHVDRAVTALGTVGYPAKGLALLALGVLVVVSTATADPEDSTGLDGALQGIADQPFGEAALGVLAVGLMLYGVYLMLRSRYDVM